MLILSRDAVRAALPMRAAIEAVRWGYEAWSTGQVTMPPRLHLDLPEREAVTLVMPAAVSANPDSTLPASLAVKVVSVFPQNTARGLSAVQGAALVLDNETGECRGILDGAILTAIRTGASSGVATDLLARRDSSVAAILGAGAQAETQLLGVCAVRPIQTVQVYNRTRSRAEAFAARLAGQESIPNEIRIAETAQDAVREADIICTATMTEEPLFDDADLKPGVHINAVGGFRREMQEVPPRTVQRASVFVDNRAAVLAEAGDLIKPIDAGLINASHILGEIGAVLAGSVPGRLSASEVTLFKSVGMAALDAVTAAVALSRAGAQGIGQRIVF